MLTSAADFPGISKSNSIAYFNRGHTWTQFTHNTYTFVSQYLAGMKVVQVGSAQARVRSFDEDFIVSERFGRVVGDYVARDATKYVKGDAVGGHLGVEKYQEKCRWLQSLF